MLLVEYFCFLHSASQPSPTTIHMTQPLYCEPKNLEKRSKRNVKFLRKFPLKKESEVKWKLLSRVRLFVPPWTEWILQARILEWVAFTFSRGSSLPRNRTQVSCIVDRFFTSWATREAPNEGKIRAIGKIYLPQKTSSVNSDYM